MTAKYPSDAIRLYVALYAPETDVRNFVMREFEDWYAAFFLPLARKIDNLTSMAMAEPCSDLSAFASHYGDWCKASSKADFSISHMANACCAVADLLLSQAENNHLKSWQLWAEMVEPLCPNFAATIYESLAQR
jgi:methionyl-tRNA synthetase